MLRLHTVSAAVALLLMISVSACSSGPAAPASPTQPAAAPVQPTQPPASQPTPVPQPTQAPEPTQAPQATASSETAEKQSEDFDPNNFDRSTQITNEWLPLKPGTRFVYEGKSVDDSGTLVPHRIVVNVTT